MDRHAGFAAALTIRGQTIQDLQRIGYHAGTVPHRLSGSIPGVAADFFLDLPRLEFHQSDQNQIRLVLQAWGPLTITPDGQPAETRLVLFDAVVLALPEVGLVVPANPELAPQLTLALGGQVPPLVSLSVQPLTGGPFSAAAQGVIDSSTSFRVASFVVRTVSWSFASGCWARW